MFDVPVGGGVFRRCISSRLKCSNSYTTCSSSCVSGEARWGAIIGDELHGLSGGVVYIAENGLLHVWWSLLHSCKKYGC